MTQEVAERFWAKVRKTDGCWEWMGARRGKGYGQFYLNGRTQHAHRVAWELVHGPIPPGMQALHRCDNPPCVRPADLFLGTNHDNVLDRHSKGRTKISPQARARAQRAKTQCCHGHPLSGPNLYTTPDGRRDCRVCRRVASVRARTALRRARGQA